MYRFAMVALLIIGPVTLAGATAPLNDAEIPECSDGFDNDGDGKTDYSPVSGVGDPQCIDAGDYTERSKTITTLTPNLMDHFSAGGKIWSGAEVLCYLGTRPGAYLLLNYVDWPGSGYGARVASAVPGWRSTLRSAGKRIRVLVWGQYAAVAWRGEENNGSNASTLGGLACRAGLAHYCEADHTRPCTESTQAADCSGLVPTTCDTTPADSDNAHCNQWYDASDTMHGKAPNAATCPGASGSNCCDSPNTCSSPNGDMHVRHPEAARFNTDMIMRVRLADWNAAVSANWGGIDFCEPGGERNERAHWRWHGLPQAPICALKARCWQGPKHGQNCVADSDCAGDGGTDKSWDPRGPICSAPNLYALYDASTGGPGYFHPMLDFRNEEARKWNAWRAQMALEDAGFELDEDVGINLIFKIAEFAGGGTTDPGTRSAHCWKPNTTWWGLYTRSGHEADSRCDGGPLVLPPISETELIRFHNQQILDIRDRLASAGYKNFKLATTEKPSPGKFVGATPIEDPYLYLRPSVESLGEYVGETVTSYVPFCGD